MNEPIDNDPLKLTSTATTTVMTRTFTVTKQQPTIILASQGQTTLSERSVLPKITVKTEPPDYDLEPTGACFSMLICFIWKL